MTEHTQFDATDDVLRMMVGAKRAFFSARQNAAGEIVLGAALGEQGW